MQNLHFSSPWKTTEKNNPQKGQEGFPLLIKTLQTCWTLRISIPMMFFFCVFWGFQIFSLPDSLFPDFQIPRFQEAGGHGDGDGRTLISQPDPSLNTAREQIRRKELLLRYSKQQRNRS